MKGRRAKLEMKGHYMSKHITSDFVAEILEADGVSKELVLIRLVTSGFHVACTYQ